MVELILCRLHFFGGIEPINKVGQKTYVQFLFGLELPALYMLIRRKYFAFFVKFFYGGFDMPHWILSEKMV